MITEISLIVAVIGLAVGLGISYVFTKLLMKNKIEIEKARIENEKNDELLTLEKENSQLEERVLKIGDLENKILKYEDELKQKISENTKLEKTIAELTTSLEKERENSIEKLKILENSKEELKNEFKNLSN